MLLLGLGRIPDIQLISNAGYLVSIFGIWPDIENNWKLDIRPNPSHYYNVFPSITRIYLCCCLLSLLIQETTDKKEFVQIFGGKTWKNLFWPLIIYFYIL